MVGREIRAACIAACLALAACSARGGGSNELANQADADSANKANALAATVTPSPVVAEYKKIRLPVDAYYMDQVEIPRAGAPIDDDLFFHDPDHGLVFGLDDCGDAHTVDADPRDVEAYADELAQVTASMRASLFSAGYPRSVVEPPLHRFVSRELYRADHVSAAPQAKLAKSQNVSDPDTYVDLGEPDFEALVGDLNSLRKQHSPKLPVIDFGGDCGAGEGPVILVSRPSGATFWTIKDFDWILCQKKGLDPWNRDQCEKWSEQDPKQPNFLNGLYRYEALWPDGFVKRDQRTLTPSDVLGNTKTYTIQR